MKSSQDVAMIIKKTAKAKNIPVGKMLDECGLSVNALATMQSRGYYPRLEAIAKIADYLQCSIDYLLGRADEPTSIALSPDDKRKAIQARIMTMTEAELKRLEDILNFVTSRNGEST